MNIKYFNYRSHIAESRWDRSSFLKSWWRIYDRDPYWVPPNYPQLRRELEPRHNSHIARLDSAFLFLEALPRKEDSSYRKRNADPSEVTPFSAYFEEPVAAGILLYNPRRRDRTAYLALYHSVNDDDSLGRFLLQLTEALGIYNIKRIIGPTGLSPFIESGLLVDHWDQLPPLFTSYNPPYLPDILEQSGSLLSSSRLYTLDIAENLPFAPPSAAVIQPLDLFRLSHDLLPLFQSTFSDWTDFPHPDAEEADFLLRWISAIPVIAWQAQVEDQIVGFIVLSPDLAQFLKRVRGGRNLVRRAWLSRAGAKQAAQGRLIFGGVHPEWRNQGIGRILLYQSILSAREQGWEKLVIGPVPENSNAGEFLEKHGSHPQQTYRLFQWDLFGGY